MLDRGGAEKRESNEHFGDWHRGIRWRGGRAPGGLETCASQEFEFAEVVLQNGDASIWTGLHTMIARCQPGLLLLCAVGDQLAEADQILKELRNKLLEMPLLLALDVGRGKHLPDFVQMGVTDFVVAPFRECELLPGLRRWLRNADDGNSGLSEFKRKLGLGHLIGESPELVAAIRQTPKFAASDAAVLLNGETGTGKEIFARAIHYLSPRAANPFIPVNCGAIPSELMENELFGHEPGAFTGAEAATRGLIAEAEGGTLFLDEIDTLPLQTQVKLLRFLQDHVYRPLGAGKLCGANIRVIAASNAKLESAVRAGRFRADLFYRINVLSLSLPPLRERRQDIMLLARHFAVECAREMKIAPKEFSPAALHKLTSYHWPGNVRELQNIIQRAIVLVEDNVIRPMEIELPGQSDLMEAKSFKALKAQVVEDFPILKLATSAGQTTGTLANLGRDQRLSLQHNDWVEVVDDIFARSGQVDSLLQVTDIDVINQVVTLNGTSGVVVGQPSTTHPILRRWDGTGPIT